MYQVTPGCTPAYLQWASNTLLHLSWAMQDTPTTFSQIGEGYSGGGLGGAPLDILLNRLVASCIFLGWPVHKEVLEIQDKLYVDF
jgi:hypothetical protein